jgi:broad specificity phosphatase PhoE
VQWYLVRHGEIAANIKSIYAGQSPERLTPRGRNQALRIAESLLHLGIDQVYCSPVARSVETAQIIGAYWGKRPILEPAFTEMTLGPWEGKSESEIQRESPLEWQIWNTRPGELFIKGRETLTELRRRVLKGLERIQAMNGYNSVLIISHVAIIRILLLDWQGLDLNLYRTIPVRHGEIFSWRGQK